MESSSSFPSFYDIYDTPDLESGLACKTIAISHIPRMNPVSNLFCEHYEYQEEPQYFLDSCFLCKKLLSRNKDIFMYRGNTPFCSEECRNEQIEIDEAKEKGCKNSSNPSSSKQSHRNQPKQKSQRVPVWAW